MDFGSNEAMSEMRAVKPEALCLWREMIGMYHRKKPVGLLTNMIRF